VEPARAIEVRRGVTPTESAHGDGVLRIWAARSQRSEQVTRRPRDLVRPHHPVPIDRLRQALPDGLGNVGTKARSHNELGQQSTTTHRIPSIPRP
jgi:hypothetical protein